MSELPARDYGDFLVAVKTRIRQAQYQALRATNKELLALYWDLGESIHRKQEALGWGKSVVENLARDLQAEFPGQNGFSAANLWLMRQFYVEYRDCPILEPLVREISWAKNVLVMKRCKDQLDDKNKTVVKYALRTAGRPIGVATYTVVPQLPETYRDQLPSPEAIAERLRLWAAESAQHAADDQAEGAG